MPAIMTLPLAPQGSDFRRLVWYLLCQIPYGQTTTYGDLAKQIEERTGKAMSAQGIDKKIALLHLEGGAVKA